MFVKGGSVYVGGAYRLLALAYDMQRLPLRSGDVGRVTPTHTQHMAGQRAGSRRRTVPGSAPRTVSVTPFTTWPCAMTVPLTVTVCVAWPGARGGGAGAGEAGGEACTCGEQTVWPLRSDT